MSSSESRAVHSTPCRETQLDRAVHKLQTLQHRYRGMVLWIKNNNLITIISHMIIINSVDNYTDIWCMPYDFLQKCMLKLYLLYMSYIIYDWHMHT